MKAIHQAIDTHFPDRVYKTFAPLFRNKARAYNLAKELAGACRGKQGFAFFSPALLHAYLFLTFSHPLLSFRPSTRGQGRGNLTKKRRSKKPKRTVLIALLHLSANSLRTSTLLRTTHQKKINQPTALPLPLPLLKHQP